MSLKTKCKIHWKNMGIDNPETLQKYIKEVFQIHNHQENVIIDIYKIVFPEWDQIKTIKGYPAAGDSLWKFICNLFIEFDSKHHPECFKGGCWMNTGFSANKNLSPWDISFDN